MKGISEKVIVSDASPLIVLARINQLFLLESLFENIYIPSEVANECFLDVSRPGAKMIHQSVENNKIQIYTAETTKISIDLPSFLGIGESAAINLAYHLNAPLLIDDSCGRKIAQKNNIPIIGTAGLLLLAKNQSIIPRIKPLIKKLEDCNFRLSSELVKKILSLAKEL
jgi:predicted nucleic acid-binding protein